MNILKKASENLKIKKLLNSIIETFKTMKLLQVFCRKKAIVFDRPYFMGILNRTDDSFYDGGKYHSVDLALRQTEHLMVSGADFVDIGGESSRPGSTEVPLSVELQRVLPVIEAIKNRFPEVMISIDTVKSQVAAEALQMGVDLINDISGGEHSAGETMKLAITHHVPITLMHRKGISKTMQENVQYKNVVAEVCSYLKLRIETFMKLGGDPGQVIVDPGIGFGKYLNHNLQILRNIPTLLQIGNPLLIGASMKKMIGELLGYEHVEDRTYGTIGIHLAALHEGCNIVRVHDVRSIRDAYKCFDSI